MKGQFTEDREDWQKERHRHCEEVYTDLEGTKDVQEESRTEHFKKNGNQQFTEQGRNAEFTVDLVLQAGAKSSGNKVIGPEDVIVSEMIKKAAHGENLHHCEVLSRTIHGPDGISKLVEGCETGVLEEAGCCCDWKESRATGQVPWHQ